MKVEDPKGDTTRFLPPGPEAGRGAMFINLNRGKRSLALDLKQPAAREALLRLAADADVFLHSMRAGAIKRLGLDYSAVSEANPKSSTPTSTVLDARDGIVTTLPMMTSCRRLLAWPTSSHD
nr:CoA transferase [Sphingomonas daechungensis]